MEIQKKIDFFFDFFSIILLEILPDPFSSGWSHQPRLKGPPALAYDPANVDGL
jgi:hypothetical protein